MNELFWHTNRHTNGWLNKTIFIILFGNYSTKTFLNYIFNNCRDLHNLLVHNVIYLSVLKTLWINVSKATLVLSFRIGDPDYSDNLNDINSAGWATQSTSKEIRVTSMQKEKIEYQQLIKSLYFNQYWSKKVFEIL